MHSLHAKSYGLKRAFDVTVVLVTAPLWIVAAAVVAAVVRLTLGPGVLFRQVRPGLNERPFEMIKFRTMRNSLDARGRPLPDEVRLTRAGRLLRSTSLDELPELINVLRGEMSLVGPRPLLPQYLDRYSERHRRRHLVRPGVTGLAQVSGRNAITWEEKLDFDVTYVERCSFRLDVWILWRTAVAVVTRSGINAPGDATMPEFTGYSPPPVTGTPGSPRSPDLGQLR